MLQITPNNPVPSNVRYCSNCKHFLHIPHNRSDGHRFVSICKRFYTLDVIDGSTKYANASDMREQFDKCGMQARYFEGLSRQDNLTLPDTPTSNILREIDEENERKSKSMQ